MWIRTYSDPDTNAISHICISNEKKNYSEGNYEDVNLNKSRHDLIAPTEVLQIAYLNLSSGTTFIPHVHEIRKIVERSASTQECWIVVEGEILATLYSINRVEICKLKLDKNDFIVTLNGGHNYEIMSETAKIIEIKSGPYDSQNDKRRFEV